MLKAIMAIIVIAVVVAVVVFVFVLGGSDDDGGGENAIPIQVKNAKNLGALHIELVYDSSILEATEVRLVGLGENGQIDYELKTSGRVIIGFINAMGANGSGDLVEIIFSEKADGNSQLSLENVVATDANTLYDLVVKTSIGSLDTKNDNSKAPIINLGP